MPADAQPLAMALEMPDEMSSCSCSNSDHENTRHGRGVRLFGVDLLSEGAMRKSVSLSNLSHYAGSSCNNLSMQEHLDPADGYVSDGLVQTNSNARARRKGVPWTEDEHRLFLLGLQKLGKGDWRGISKTFVTTRTPTQVASHAQKYFIRQQNLSKRKRRSSLFDISPAHESALSDISLVKTGNLQSSFLELGLGHDRVSVPAAPLEKIMEEKVFFPAQDGRSGFEEQVADSSMLQLETNAAGAPPPAITSQPALWLDLGSQPQQPPAPTTEQASERSASRCNVVRPVASVSTGPVRIEDREFPSEPPILSLKLEQPVRHSAFHFASGGAGLETPIQCT